MTAGVLLAAGASRRMGGDNKLLLPVRGRPLVTWPAGALTGAGLEPVVAVVGRDADAVTRALSGLAVTCVRNDRHRDGMGSSVAAGVRAVPPEADAVAVAVGDLPGLRSDLVAAVVAAFRADPRGIAVPVFRGRRGHPVVFDLGRYRPALESLCGDAGARGVLAAHPDDVLEVPVDDPGVVQDVDTPEAYGAVVSDQYRGLQ